VNVTHTHTLHRSPTAARAHNSATTRAPHEVCPRLAAAAPVRAARAPTQCPGCWQRPACQLSRPRAAGQPPASEGSAHCTGDTPASRSSHAGARRHTAQHVPAAAALVYTSPVSPFRGQLLTPRLPHRRAALPPWPAHQPPRGPPRCTTSASPSRMARSSCWAASPASWPKVRAATLQHPCPAVHETSAHPHLLSRPPARQRALPGGWRRQRLAALPAGCPVPEGLEVGPPRRQHALHAGQRRAGSRPDGHDDQALPGQRLGLPAGRVCSPVGRDAPLLHLQPGRGRKVRAFSTHGPPASWMGVTAGLIARSLPAILSSPY
jgi:hypothetical protein